MAVDFSHPFYCQLKKNIRENPRNFIAVVGAGISMPGGIPSWQGLKDGLVKIARSRISEYSAEEGAGIEQRIDRVSTDTDFWRAFSELESLLGRNHYEHSIKNIFEKKQNNNPPENYNLIWELGVGGIFSLNLDAFSENSFAKLYGKVPDLATAWEPSRYEYFLTNGNQFVFHPHGCINDSSTWVFKKSEFEQIVTDAYYKKFMESVLSNRSTLILGLNTEDFSIQYQFTHALNSMGKLSSPHYAVIEDPAPEMIREYAEKNIFIIPYSSDKNDHVEVNEILKDLLEFIPLDKDFGSVYSSEISVDTTLTPEQLESYTSEEIRTILNEKVAEILGSEDSPSDLAHDNLEKFYNEYVMPIHKAWLVQPNTKSDILFGYKASSRVGKGAFGQVFEAEHVDTKERVAIKLLLPELRDHRDYLNSFRRGVRSMNILKEKNIHGMVKIKEAYEVPACIIMDFIDGPTLRKAVEQRFLADIEVCLDVLHKTGKIVKNGHDLSELVLHRDLKPDNIILKNYYGKEYDIEVIVLDFDLSWHKGASDMSIVDGARSQGYAAPEQTASFVGDRISTRNTAVDVFGFGMVAYFLLTGVDPRPNEQNFSDFRKNIILRIMDRYRCAFLSIPDYLADLICSSTYDKQSMRIGFESLIESIELLKDVVSANSIKSSHPILLLEILKRIDACDNYEVSDYGRKVRSTFIDPSKTIELSFKDVHLKPHIFVRLDKIEDGSVNRNIEKYLDKAKDQAVSCLKSFGFSEIDAEVGRGRISITCSCAIEEQVPLEFIEGLSSCIIDTRRCLDLS